MEGEGVVDVVSMWYRRVSMTLSTAPLRSISSFSFTSIPILSVTGVSIPYLLPSAITYPLMKSTSVLVPSVGEGAVGGPGVAMMSCRVEERLRDVLNITRRVLSVREAAERGWDSGSGGGLGCGGVGVRE